MRSLTDASADLAAELDIVRTPVETLHERAAQLRRRRRAAWASVPAFIIICSAMVIFTSRDSPDVRVAADAERQGVHEPLEAVPPPAVAIIHRPGGTGTPGEIAVIDTRTGAPTGVLGAEYDPYLMNGFVSSADRQSVFYTRLNEPAQRIEIVRTSVLGGDAEVVAENGAQPQPSDDGRTLAYIDPRADRLVLADLAGGAARTFPAPGRPGEVISSYGWQRDTDVLLAIVVTPRESCEGPAGSTCDTETAVISPPTAWTLDTSSESPAWEEAPPPDALDTWEGIRIVGPGRSPGTVLVEVSDATTTQPIAIATLDPTGVFVDRVPLPADTRVLAVDRSGTNLLLAVANGALGELAWMSLASSPTTRLGITATQATW